MRANQELSASESAKILGFSVEEVYLLEQQGVLPLSRSDGKRRYYLRSAVNRLQSSHQTTLAQDAEAVAATIQQDVVRSLSTVQKIVLVFGFSTLFYLVLVASFGILFILAPQEMAHWLGLAPTKETSVLTKVLGATTRSTELSPSVIQAMLQPIGKVSLGLVKSVSPATYEEVTHITILDPNDIFAMREDGAIVSFQEMEIPNLNASSLQGKQPGNNVGDIAVIGENGSIQGLTPLVVESPNAIVTTETNTPSVNVIAGTNVTTTTSDTGTITLSITDSPSFSGLTITGLGSGVMHVSSGGSLSSSALVNSDIADDTIDLTTKVTNTLPISNGGTGATSFTSNGILYGNGTSGLQVLAPSTSGYLLQTNGTGTAPSWGLGSTIITNLTNSNLSGSAGITNANLANSSVTITTGSGLSGGGTVSLGSGLTLTNSGVTALSGATNQVIVSQSTGAVSLSLPQAIAATSSPTFAQLTLTDSSNQLVLGSGTTGTLSWAPTSSRTLTLPDGTDTLIGKATTDVLTNKTLTAPAINGTITTTGLTLPAFTASGNITGSGSPTISSFGAINGLTLTAASDGFTIAGGTASRTLTVTGADITIGSLIKPTSTGALSLQSNGANLLSLDAGGAAGVSLGATNASSVAIGRSGVTTSIAGTASASALTVGGGATISKHLSGTNTFDAASVSLGTCGDLGTITIVGARAGDTVVANPETVSGGIESLLLNWNAYVSADDTVTIRACSVATLGGQNPPSQTWRADVWQH